LLSSDLKRFSAISFEPMNIIVGYFQFEKDQGEEFVLG
jgi:hypothetical protein